jgi:hypothetical protein
MSSDGYSPSGSKGLLSLPAELLIHIIEECQLHEDPSAPSDVWHRLCPGRSTQLRSPKDTLLWSYTHICRDLRYVLLSSPALWTTIPSLTDFDLQQSADPDDSWSGPHVVPRSSRAQAADLAATELHLARSRDLPLTVNIRYRLLQASKVYPSLHLLLQHSQRLRRLTLWTTYTALEAMTELGLLHRLQGLQSLQVEIPTSTLFREDYLFPSFDMFSGSSELTEFTAMWYHSSFPHLQLPLSQLRKLHLFCELSRGNIRWWRDTLERLTDLLELHLAFRVLPGSQTTILFDPPVVSPNLHSLTFEPWDRTALESLASLRFPNLTHLKITCTIAMSWTMTLFLAISPALTSFGKSLVSLELENFSFRPRETDNYLCFNSMIASVGPNLQSLTICLLNVGGGRPATLLQELTPSRFTTHIILKELTFWGAIVESGIQRSLCPRLNELRLERLVLDEPGLLIQMLESRLVYYDEAGMEIRPDHAPELFLQRVRISYRSNPSLDSRDAFTKDDLARMDLVTARSDFEIERLGE